MGSKSFLAAILAASQLGSSTLAADTSSDPCQIVAAQQQKVIDEQKLPPNSPNLIYLAPIDAEPAYQCIISIPFNKSAASTLMDTVEQYAAFHTTHAFLKDPPDSYQMPPVDISARYDKIKQNIANNVYKNQYNFDLDLLDVTRATHDSHYCVHQGVLGLFAWTLEDGIISVSSDGKELPCVYAYSDIANNVVDASPIVEMGGRSVLIYLRKYLEENALPTGLMDPHAEWNVLMDSSAAKLGKISTQEAKIIPMSRFQSTTIYNGESIKGKFGNGSEFEWKYFAGSASLLERHGLTDGESIYAKVVAQKEPKQTCGLESSDEIEEEAKFQNLLLRNSPTSVPFLGFPDEPIVIQDNFIMGGAMSGYLLKNDSVGVLSIPSFQVKTTQEVYSFGETLGAFISKAKDAKMKKIVVDLSGNPGGNLLVGFETFRHFFPNIDPATFFRARAILPLRTLGSAVSQVVFNKDDYFNDTIRKLLSTPACFINIDNTRKADANYSEWNSYDEFFGPIEDHGDQFTLNAQYDLSTMETPFPFAFAGYSPHGNLSKGNVDYDQPPWKADDIIFLLDGNCVSTCHLFASLMKSDAGVKSLVVGGIPQYGPMQGVAGSRGASLIDYGYLDKMSQALRRIVKEFDAEAGELLKRLGISKQEFDDLPPKISNSPSTVSSGSINALDTILPADTKMPRQFVYEAASCRLFYTGDMIRDLSLLWKKAARYAEGDESVCVAGSVDGPGSKPNESITSYTGFSYEKVWAKANSTDVPSSSSRNSRGGGQLA